MIPLSLAEIAAVVGGTVEGDAAVTAAATVTAPAVIDGRQAEPGGLFVAFAGAHADGHDYVDQAAEAGAVAVLGSRATALPTVVVLELGDRGAAEHRAVGRYAAFRSDVVVTVGPAARAIAEGAGERAVPVADNAAAVAWLRRAVGGWTRWRRRFFRSGAGLLGEARGGGSPAPAHPRRLMYS